MSRSPKETIVGQAENIKKFIRGFYVVCALVILADVVHQMVVIDISKRQIRWRD